MEKNNILTQNLQSICLQLNEIEVLMSGDLGVEFLSRGYDLNLIIEDEEAAEIWLKDKIEPMAITRPSWRKFSECLNIYLQNVSEIRELGFSFPSEIFTKKSTEELLTEDDSVTVTFEDEFSVSFFSKGFIKIFEGNKLVKTLRYTKKRSHFDFYR